MKECVVPEVRLYASLQEYQSRLYGGVKLEDEARNPFAAERQLNDLRAMRKHRHAVPMKSTNDSTPYLSQIEYAQREPGYASKRDYILAPGSLSPQRRTRKKPVGLDVIDLKHILSAPALLPKAKAQPDSSTSSVKFRDTEQSCEPRRPPLAERYTYVYDDDTKKPDWLYSCCTPADKSFTEFRERIQERPVTRLPKNQTLDSFSSFGVYQKRNKQEDEAAAFRRRLAALEGRWGDGPPRGSTRLFTSSFLSLPNK